MPSFIMRAKTKDGNYYTFSLQDIPLYITNNECILVKKDNSPILLGNTIHIGDSETHLFVGDIIRKDATDFLICYERGFYGISKDYVRCYLNQLNSYEVVGNYFDDGFDIKLQFKKKLRFKYKDIIFTLRDVIGCYEDNILLRLCKENIIPSECNQDVGICIGNKRLYLGDRISDGIVTLHNGRICAVKDNEIKDLDGKDYKYHVEHRDN